MRVCLPWDVEGIELWAPDICGRGSLVDVRAGLKSLSPTEYYPTFIQATRGSDSVRGALLLKMKTEYVQLWHSFGRRGQCQGRHSCSSGFQYASGLIGGPFLDASWIVAGDRYPLLRQSPAA